MSGPTFPPAQAQPGSTGRRLWLTGEHRGADEGESFDALTDLFLGEVARGRREGGAEVAAEPAPTLRLVRAEEPAAPEGGEGTRVEAPALAPFVECLIVGNLPVLASAWASQYVREVARAAGRPVAFLRVQAGFATVELVGEGPGSGENHVAPAADLDSALRLAAGFTSRWVVRVDPADEPVVAAGPGVGMVTLLSGADEIARINAYASLKTIGEKGAAGGGAGAATPAVRIAIMGSAEPSAEAAAKRLVEIVKRFLGREVEHAVCSAKIRASRAAEIVFNGRIDVTAAGVVQRLGQLLGRNGAEAEIQKWVPAVEAAAVQRELAEPAVPERVTGADKPVNAESGEAAAPALVDDVALWAAASGGTVEPAEAVDELPRLTAFIQSARAIEVGCPYAEGVQFAVGGDGRLHLMARSAGGAGAEMEAALAGLMVASTWAGAHAGLLRAAVPGLGGGTGEPVLHLFTGTPRLTRRLLETSLRVHVLGRTGAGGAWFSAELN